MRDEDKPKATTTLHMTAKQAFVVSDYTTAQLNKDGTYSPVPNDLSLTFTEYAPCFDFSDDFSQQYLLLYAGEGKDLDELRAAFETEMSTDINADMLASFEVCDLGGDTLVLLVPRYKGVTIWIKEIDIKGISMISARGARMAIRGLSLLHFDDSAGL